MVEEAAGAAPVPVAPGPSVDAAEGDDGDVDGAEGEGGGVGRRDGGGGGGGGKREGRGGVSRPRAAVVDVGGPPPPLVGVALQVEGVLQARADALSRGLEPTDPAGASRGLRSAKGLVACFFFFVEGG